MVRVSSATFFSRSQLNLTILQEAAIALNQIPVTAVFNWFKHRAMLFGAQQHCSYVSAVLQAYAQRVRKDSARVTPSGKSKVKSQKSKVIICFPLNRLGVDLIIQILH